MRMTFTPPRPAGEPPASHPRTRRSALLITAAMLLLLALCACGGQPAPAPAEAEETPPPYDTVQDGVLTVVTCTDFPPYSYLADSGPTGIEPALAEALAGRLGLSLEIYEADYAALEEEVAQGRADLALAGLLPGETGEGLVYTVDYCVNSQLILVPEDGADALSEGLAGHFIGVFAGSQGDLRLSWDLEDAGTADLVRFDTDSEALIALGARWIDCFVLDAAPARAMAEANGGLELLSQPYLSERYAGLMREDNEQLYKAVNDALGALVSSGEAEEIAARYLPAG